MIFCNKFFYFFFSLFCLCSFSLAQTEEDFVYYKNFVRHSEGDNCTHLPPESGFITYLNNDLSRILIENAPRWETGGDPNITGTGVFGVELGNFSDPPIQPGDSVFMKFFCYAEGQHGLLRDQIAGIPWGYFPKTLYLRPANLPAVPQNITLSFTTSDRRLIQWSAEPGATYSVYRREVKDTVIFGQSRMLYYRLAEGIISGSFVDTTQSQSAHGYIVIPKKLGIYGLHSPEVKDFPETPEQIEAAVAYTNPFRVAVTWIYPADTIEIRYRIYRGSEENFALDSLHFVGETNSQYFLDEQVLAGEIYYYRVIALNRLNIPGNPSAVASVRVEPFAGGLPDPDVLYITRLPRYPRYEVVYDPPGYNPRLSPQSQNLKHYPSVGEMMTYRSIIRNSGGGTIENVQVDWYVDSVNVHTEMIGRLFPRQRHYSQIQHLWTDHPVMIRCETYPVNPVTEVTTGNNSLSIRSNALSFHFHAEKNILDLFETHQNPLGSYSFEDWSQVQLKKMNQFFRQAVYPAVTPTGVPEYVFLDTVSYYQNGQLPSGGTHAPENILWDGQWGFTGDAAAINYFQNIVLGQNNGMDWALLHELGHQIGLIDLYNMDVQESELQVIEPRTGQKPPLGPVAWDVLYYSSRSNYLMHSNFQNGFSDHSAGGLFRNLSKRRGYFGDYLKDIPSENTFLIGDNHQNPVADADISIYQQQDHIIPDIPKFKGQTDSQGYFPIPHQTDPAYHGGIYVQNPFSTIYSAFPHVVGTNSV
ncbi:MAG: hypothetical protein EH225_10460, partial [Calditrichaeota bacterium]